MEAQKKNIKQVDAVEGAKGKYQKVTWTDGKSDNIFKKEHMDVIKTAQAGDLTVEITKEKQGAYWNVTNVVLPLPPGYPQPSAPASVPASKPAPVQTNGHTDNNKDRSVMLSYAKDLAVAGVLNPDDITKKADEFLAWLNK